MKPRTVIVQLEIGTDLPLAAMRAPSVWTAPQAVADTWNVEGVTVRVAQPAKHKAKARRRKARRKA